MTHLTREQKHRVYKAALHNIATSLTGLGYCYLRWSVLAGYRAETGKESTGDRDEFVALHFPELVSQTKENDWHPHTRLHRFTDILTTCIEMTKPLND